MYNPGPTKTFKAGEALSERRLVKIESGTVTDPPEVVYAGAGEDAIGVTEHQAAAGDPVSVRLLNDAGTFEIECLVDAAISRGTLLYAGASGMVTDASSGSVVGVALEAGEDNAHIEVAIDNRKPTTAAGTTITDSGNKFSGSTVEAALQECAAAATIDIADAGEYTAETTVEGALQELYATGRGNLIADPGDAGVIPVTKSGNCALTSGADAETRTLAIPGKVGQLLAITLDVDGGGDIAITVAAAINQTGNTVITLGDAGDTVVLIGVQVAGALVWRVLVNDGAALSTP